jgi:hypothetical protein
MIILDDANDSEYYRWRFWEAVSAANAATSPSSRNDYIRLAERYRIKLAALGDSSLPSPKKAK